MSRPPANSPSPAPAPGSSEAGAWVWRLDRGLSPEEQDEFFAWLAANPANAEALSRGRSHWARLNQLADWRPEHSARPNPDLLAPSHAKPWRRFRWPLALAAAAAVAGALFLWQSRVAPAPGARVARQEDRRILPDASSVRLNAAARIAVHYSAAERRIHLEQGEAFFTVAKDLHRPFVVRAGGVDVRAVGTAFNVRIGESHLDVIVAAGTVAIASAATPGPLSPDRAVQSEVAVLQARQRLSLPLAPQAAPAQVVTLTRQEIQRSLSWQHGLMTFREEPLAAIVAELNRLNETQVVLLDDALASSRFSGTIRSDNVDGFTRLLQSAFGAQIEQAADGEIRLRTKRD